MTEIEDFLNRVRKAFQDNNFDDIEKRVESIKESCYSELGPPLSIKAMNKDGTIIEVKYKDKPTVVDGTEPVKSLASAFEETRDKNLGMLFFSEEFGDITKEMLEAVKPDITKMCGMDIYLGTPGKITMRGNDGTEVSITPMEEYGEHPHLTEDELAELNNIANQKLISKLEALRKEIENSTPVMLSDNRIITITGPQSEKRISKNCFKGNQITTAEQLFNLALNGKAIYYNGHMIGWRGIKPAVAFTQQQFNVVMFAIERKDLFEVINTTHE